MQLLPQPICVRIRTGSYFEASKKYIYTFCHEFKLFSQHILHYTLQNMTRCILSINSIHFFEGFLKKYYSAPLRCKRVALFQQPPQNQKFVVEQELEVRKFILTVQSDFLYVALIFCLIIHFNL
eukprot:TRINITY_DN49749_c0_g1_i2.p1 TRINITY_DN49749_c0_g1~~TRINITY_DN49749_c0_g1_i2.p1  ORF type:complete len:124 (+),score=0.61 TRINITY_DN49749_c0_g1_i2:341-712(+)